MKKYFITLMLALVCIFALVVSVSAKEYTVASDSEYQAVYEKAVDGDTIIVSQKLTCEIQATKNITYILKADWESAKINVASDSEVSFVADGGDYKIMPSGYSNNGWLNITEAKENVVFNFMGINEGTVIFDGTKATSEYVSNVTVASDITWNFFDGSAIANFNPTTKATGNVVCIIYASTFNMYEGSKIYANKIVNVPLVKTNDFHMFGGEIFGNLLTSTSTDSNSCGAIYIKKQFVMWDGKIYNNIFKAVSKNNVGFFTAVAGKSSILLGGELGVNYVSGTGGNDVSAMFGASTGTNTYEYYTSNFKFGTRKIFSAGICELAYDEATGKTIYQISNPTFGTVSENWQGNAWNYYKGLSDNVASFFNVDIKQIKGNTFYELDLIDLFVIGVTAANNSGVVDQNRKNYTYSYTGKTALTIPSGVGAWATDVNDFCHKGSTVTLDQINQNMPIMLYASYENPITEETGTTLCSICKKVFVCENPEHEKTVTITYNSYMENGLKSVRCEICNTVASTETPAFFTCLGYSSSENGTDGISLGFKVNDEAISDYMTVTDKEVSYGLFAATKNALGTSDVINANGEVSNGAVIAPIPFDSFVYVTIKMAGFNTAELKASMFAIGAYLKISENGNTDYLYMQYGTPNEGEKYAFISYNDVMDIVNAKA